MIEGLLATTYILIEEAERRGISVELTIPKRICRFTYKKHQEFIGTYIKSQTTSLAKAICQKKDVTKIFLKEADLSMAVGEVFNKNQFRDAFKYFVSHNPLVVKPSSAEGGNNVFTGVTKSTTFKKAWKSISLNSQKIILEQMFTGSEYRILATKGKVLAATLRIPAFVEGHLNNTIFELIQIKNCEERSVDIFRKKYNLPPGQKIKIDSEVKRYLKKNKLSLTSRPKDGEMVYLRENSNISTGGTSVDCTDIVHPSIKRIALAAINSIPGLPYGGVDIMVEDISKEAIPGKYAILEVNENPGLSIHHFPHVGQPRNVAKEIIDLAFPETINN